MGREQRSIDPDFIYHANCRGSNRGLLAWDVHDFESLYGELAKVADRHRWDVFAWCLMHNHYHVILRAPFGGFSEGFQTMNSSHSRRTNRRHGRTDHLFRHRPWTSEIRSDAHLISAILYVLRNPVSAGLVEQASAWRYSSYRASAGLESAPAWLALEELLALFGHDADSARAELARLVQSGPPLVSNTDEEPLAPAIAGMPHLTTG